MIFDRIIEDCGSCSDGLATIMGEENLQTCNGYLGSIHDYAQECKDGMVDVSDEDRQQLKDTDQLFTVSPATKMCTTKCGLAIMT
jgi:hypothetical protein